MAFISVTRLRLRSPLFLPIALWHSVRSLRQVSSSKGFISGRVAQDASLAFWTVTLWQDQRSMQHYRDAKAHGNAKVWLDRMCDEATRVHWQPTEESLPDWLTLHQKMTERGYFNPLTHPSANHLVQIIPPPKMAKFAGQTVQGKMTHLANSLNPL